MLDLGLALLQGDPAADVELTGTEQQMGTTDYMAPEQAIDSHGVDRRADIYSLGCTLYKLLTGVVPYGGPKFKTPTQKLLAHVNEPVPPLAERRADLPDGLAAIVERMLAKRPEGRFESAADVAAALMPFRAGAVLPALYAAASDERDARPSVGNGLRAVPHAATSDAQAPAASRVAETDAYLSSAFSGTDGGAPECSDRFVRQPPSAVEHDAGGNADQPRAAGPHVDATYAAVEAAQRIPPRSRRLLAFAGAAAVLLLGVVIVVKMRDGSTRRFEVKGPVQSFEVIPTDEPDSRSEPADPNHDVAKWVCDVGGRVAAANNENFASPSKWAESPADLPETFDDLMILLADCQRVSDSDLKHFKLLTKPFGLNLSRTKITDAGLLELKGLANLRFLFLDGTAITRVGLQNVGTLPNLESIELAGTATNGGDLELLKHFPRLAHVGLGPSHLSLQGVYLLSTMPDVTLGLAGVGEADLKYLGNLSHLRYLTVGPKEFNDACLESLSGLTNLTILGLFDTSVSDAGIARLASQAPRLTFLNISYGGLTDASVQHLAKLSKLEGLNLYATGVTAAGIAELRAALPNCKIQWTPKKHDTPVTDADRELVKWVLSVAGKVDVLEGDAGTVGRPIEIAAELPDEFYGLLINLADCETLADLDLARFKSFTKPLSLEISRTRITDAGLAGLHGLPNLCVLHIGATKVTRAGLENLGVLENLRELHLSATPTTDADLSLLSRFPKLDSLALGRPHLTERGAQILSTLPNLVVLHCDDPTEVECDQIAHLTQLRTLSIGGAPFNDACLEPLAKLTNLRTFGLYNTSITDQGVARLPLVPPRLESLILFGPTIGDTSVEKLAESAARQDTRLKRLALNGCHIGDAGLEKLAALNGLDALYLSGTYVTDDGLKHLHRLSKLKLLDLTNTKVTAAGVAGLKAALPGCDVQQ